MADRPRGREKNITGQGKGVGKYGSGLGTGPVGTGTGRTGSTSGSGGRSGGPTRAGGQSPLMMIILLAVLVLGGGGAGLSGLLGGGTATTQQQQQPSIIQQVQQQANQQQSQQNVSYNQGNSSGLSGLDLSALLGNSMGSVSNGWSGTNNTGKLNNSVVSGARAKRTVLKGNGKDTVTLMVYMCGTDLESNYSMGTSDLTEMASANVDNLNIIVYTGGCKQWKNSIVSSSVNQIYKVEGNGQLRCLEKNMGSAPMTDPNTLSTFIQYCAKNYPANRMSLIFWDHGGGSLSGYGYDEKNASKGSMSLAGINQALAAGGITYDFIGFDACLMATLENALMLTDYADYLIASEETEPGVGWYYTDWLTKLNANTSMPTLEIGKNIVDDFVAECNRKCRGQATTLSVIDLAELETTAPKALSSFSQSTSNLIQSNQYQTVSKARSGAREFAASNRIDQVDLIDLCNNLDTTESKALAKTLLSAIKYNKTSSSMTDAYGLSIYFPYQRTGKVKSAAATYNAIGMDDDYTKCIQQFADLGTAGQTVSASVSNYAGSPLGSLLNGVAGNGSVSSATAGSDMIGQLLGELLISSLSGGRALPVEDMTDYITLHQFDSAKLVWRDGVLTLPEEQWALVNDLEFNVFYDDGEGYIDLGLDNVFDFTDDGALVGDYDGTWLAIDNQPVAYYHTGTVDDGESYTITGYVPVLLNGERSDLLLTFDNENPHGVITGARSDYHAGETETIAKNVTELKEGDEIWFLCDYYGYDGTYQDSYRLTRSPWAYHEGAQISDVYLPNPSAASATYRFTDIYGQTYWTPPIP